MKNANRSIHRGSLGNRAVRRKSAIVTLSLLVTIGSAFFVTAPIARLESGAYAIKDAQIMTLTGKNIAKGTVVIRNGLITDVGENARIPADAQVINGTGLTVYPGLIDGYTNLGIPAPQQPAGGQGQGRAAAQAAAVAAGQNQDTALGDPSAAAADQVAPNAAGLEDARNVGVTTALTSMRQGIFLGQSALINLAGTEGSKMVVRSPVALTVQFTTSAGFFGGYPSSLMGTVSYIRQTFYDAIRYRDEVNRYNRTKKGVTRPETDKKMAALANALKGDVPVLFLVNTDLDIRRALNIADEFKLKPMVSGAMFGYRIANTLKSRNVPVILSVNFPKRPNDLPDDVEESLRTLRERAEVPMGAAKLAQAGVKFAFTSTALRPQEFIDNVKKAVESGLSKDDALRALTVNAAEIFGVSDQLGTVEVGKIANLVVTSGDLLGKDSRVRYVFVDGERFEMRKADPPAARPAGGRSGAAAVAVNPVGDWDLTIQSPQGEVNAKLSIRRDGDQLAGSLVSPMGTVQLKEAKLEGNKLMFAVSLPMGGQTIEATGTGTIEGDSIRGAMSLGPLGSVDFTGTRPR